MTKSLYAVLNVAPNADPAVIEAAYKALMKKYHPDVLTEAPSSDQQKAAEINEAFRVLRDPERRSRYDSDQRGRQEAIRRAAMAAASPPARYAPPPPPPRKRSRWPIRLLVILLAVAAFLWWRDPVGVRDMFGSGLDALAASQEAEVPATDAIRVKDIDLALQEYRRIKGKSGLLGMSAFSEDCFANQSRSPSARALDYCIAFDHAAANYGILIAGFDLPQLPRFRPEELEIRHESAALLVTNDQGWIDTRRSSLRDLTFKRLALAEPGTVDLAAEAAEAEAKAATVPVVASMVQTARPHSTTVRQPAARAHRTPPRPVARPKQGDRDFLEREGYIY